MFRGILAALGLINFGFGLLSLVQPRLVAGVIGFELTQASAVGEIRAVYGGAVMVVGVFFIMAGAINRPKPLLGALMLVFAALALGRAVSFVVDGWSFYTAVALGLEAATAAVTGYLWANPQALTGTPPGSSPDAYEHKPSS